MKRGKMLEEDESIVYSLDLRAVAEQDGGTWQVSKGHGWGYSERRCKKILGIADGITTNEVWGKKCSSFLITSG